MTLIPALPFLTRAVFLGLTMGAGLAATMGCAHTPDAPPPPCEEYEPLPVVLRGSDRLNPDRNGRSLPTVVRLLQVKSTAKADMADLSDLWDHEKELLAEDFLLLQETTIAPSQTATVPLTIAKDAKHLVVVALYQQPTGTTWRTFKALPAVADRACANPKPDPKAEKKPAVGARMRFTFEDVKIEEEP